MTKKASSTKQKSANPELTVAFHPEDLRIQGAVGKNLYIVGEWYTEDGDSDGDCLILAPASEVFRVLREWIKQKRQYDEHHKNWIAAGIDPEGTPALKFTELAEHVQCRDAKYDRVFHVTKFDSPDLEN
jgi:hypothetical protein